MKYHRILEGAAVAEVPQAKVVSKEMEVFYNPVMKLNRDVSVLLLQALHGMSKETFRVGSPLAGSGVRECRFLTELDPGIISSIEINDYSADAVQLIKRNIGLNEERLNCDEIEVSEEEATHFLLQSKGFSYIDIDPFGTPNPFLDAAVKRIQRGGILAVTATDTSALSGTYQKACERKYWATPLRNYLMHEIGIRLLIRKVQLIGAQFDKALLPVYSYAKDHYMRVFFRNQKGKGSVDTILKEHASLLHSKKRMAIRTAKVPAPKKDEMVAGPLWTGQLWDAKLAARMASVNRAWKHGQEGNQKFLDTIAAEAKAKLIGFYPFNEVRRTLKRMPRKKEELLKRKGVYPTHFESNAVKVEKLSLLF